MEQLKDEEKLQIQNYLDNKNESNLGYDLFVHLPPEVQKRCHNQSIQLVAIDNGVSVDEMREALGIVSTGEVEYYEYDSIYGGKKAQYYYELCIAEVNRVLAESKAKICDIVCNEYKYCEKRKKKEFANEHYQITIGIAEALMVLASQIPLPIIAVAVYLVKNKVLDKWCDC